MPFFGGKEDDDNSNKQPQQQKPQEKPLNPVNLLRRQGYNDLYVVDV